MSSVSGLGKGIGVGVAYHGWVCHEGGDIGVGGTVWIVSLVYSLTPVDSGFDVRFVYSGI